MKTNVKNYRKIIIIALPLFVSLFSFLVPYFIFSSFISNRFEQSYLEDSYSLVDASASEISLLWKNIETYGSTFNFIKEEDIESYIESLLEKEEHKDGYRAFIVENAYKNEINEFIDVVVNGKNQVYGFSEDLKVLELIDKLEEES